MGVISLTDVEYINDLRKEDSIVTKDSLTKIFNR